jgi:carboxylesterase type B
MMIKLILLLLTFGISLCIESNNVKVKTSSGLVEGNTVIVLNKTINQFLGIPYAEPPLNSLRFAKPQPLKKPLDVSI